MAISKDKIKQYRTLGHGLKPIVMIAGKGLTDSVLAEIDRALNDHELVKIKVSITDRENRKETIQEVCQACNADLIQEIGKVALLYRKVDNPKIKTTNVR